MSVENTCQPPLFPNDIDGGTHTLTLSSLILQWINTHSTRTSYVGEFRVYFVRATSSIESSFLKIHSGVLPSSSM